MATSEDPGGNVAPSAAPIEALPECAARADLTPIVIAIVVATALIAGALLGRRWRPARRR